ncbi:homing endonuclease associated repeat-containing protein [Halorhabdus utahensis]|uniref:homing endonuclease associated repeat-containing protein n=1 Tax=Halorhabdus utahensis TaxID=146826 RepID=UPI00247A0DB5|nr:HNH endonuclease [Halorhabdus utahensis]
MLSDEDLISDLQKFASEYGKTPTRREMNQDGPHSERPYIERFGSWNETLDEAGLEINQASHDRDEPISREELLFELQRLTDELGRPPTGPEMHDFGAFSHSIYQRKFDTWNNALREAGLDLHDNKGTPDGELISEIQSLVDELGRVPAAQDMNNKGKYMHSTYQSRFGSWSDAVREAGYEPVWGQSGFPAGEEHPGWKGGHKRYYGPSWSSARRKARERDGYTCQRCGMTDEEHLDEYGHKLHVHHIKPFRTFDDHEDANDLGNLITVCLDCHNRLEGLPLDFQTPD